MSNKYFNQVITPLIKTVQEKGDIPSPNKVSMPAVQHEDKHKCMYLMFFYYYYYWWGGTESLGICTSP
jgi:hypothetical protein